MTTYQYFLQRGITWIIPPPQKKTKKNSELKDSTQQRGAVIHEVVMTIVLNFHSREITRGIPYSEGPVGETPGDCPALVLTSIKSPDQL